MDNIFILHDLLGRVCKPNKIKYFILGEKIQMKKKRGRGRPIKKKKIGRPKIEKNSLYDAPHNYSFWKHTLIYPENRNTFLERGSEQQKKTIKEIVLYIKSHEPEFFEKINGEEILERLK